MDLVTGFVLAGGKSTRMGTDKALLELAGRPLIEHMLELARSVCPQVCVVGEPAKFSGLAPVIHDLYAGQGPLAGIHAALANSETSLNLILGVDLPFVEADFLSYLISQSRRSGSVVTVPVADGFVQTLCAVYRREFSEFAGRALAAGQNKVDAIFPQTSVRQLFEEELVKAGFGPRMFRNVNTPEDWQQAQLWLASHRVVRGLKPAGGQE
jgi:molybdopterin-guanine dinucleotide biosynthesis protein A